MGEMRTATHQEEAEQLLVAVRNSNTGKMKSIFAGLDEKDRKELANMRDQGRQPVIDIAIRNRNAASFDILVEAGASISGEKSLYGPDEPIHIAAISGSTEIAKKLLAMGAKPKPNLRNALPSHLASKYGHGELAEVLREAEKGIASQTAYLRKSSGNNHTHPKTESKGAFNRIKQKH